MTENSLLDYYGRRAAEYERVYHKPERQEDLRQLTDLLRRLVAGQDVLELACGTGFWTTRLASPARSILATDASAEVLALAALKTHPAGKVAFTTADAYDLSRVPGRFTAGLAGFWISHVPRERVPAFLQDFHYRLGPGARVILFDNRYVEGSSTPVARSDEGGNTYQRRRLDDGSEHEVLKNFPTRAELDDTLGRAGARDLEITELRYYWCATYRVAGAPARPAKPAAHPTVRPPAPSD